MLIAIIIIAILLIGILIGLFAVYHKTFYSPHKGVSETVSPEMLNKHPYHDTSVKYIDRLSEMPCEYVTTKSYDGLTLSARYYAGQPDKPLCICFHGYRGSAIRDFSGCGLFLIDEGYNVLLVDERAHWRSGGHTITFGIRERCDVLSWLTFANDRFGKNTPIYIFGISLGGGTVTMASGLKLPDNVKGVVADCPFNSPKDIIKHVCRKIDLNPDLCWPLIWLSALIFGHFNVSKTTAAEEVKKTTTPVMVIHGEADDFVPTYMSREIQSANPDMVELHTFPEADHGLSYLYDTERYQNLVKDFIRKTS